MPNERDRALYSITENKNHMATLKNLLFNIKYKNGQKKKVFRDKESIERSD